MKDELAKYLATHFRHIEKQNQAILVNQAIIMTREQNEKAREVLKQMNTRQMVDLENLKTLIKKPE